MDCDRLCATHRFRNQYTYVHIVAKKSLGNFVLIDAHQT